jgi:hypothetical protein
MLSGITLYVIMISIVILSVIILSIVMLSVMAPRFVLLTKCLYSVTRRNTKRVNVSKINRFVVRFFKIQARLLSDIGMLALQE